MAYNIRIDAIRWQIPDYLSDGNSKVSNSNIIVIVISHRLRDIRKTKQVPTL